MVRPRPEALQEAVARVGEPDRPVALDDDVIGRVEAFDEQLALAVVRSTALMRAADLLAHDQTAVEAECHAVGGGGVRANDRHGEGAKVEPLDVDARPGAGDAREVQGALAGNINRPLVRAHVDEMLQPAGEPGWRRGGEGQTARLAHIDTVLPDARPLRATPPRGPARVAR